jgi:hypothetical protein
MDALSFGQHWQKVNSDVCVWMRPEMSGGINFERRREDVN